MPDAAALMLAYLDDLQTFRRAAIGPSGVWPPESYAALLASISDNNKTPEPRGSGVLRFLLIALYA